MAGGAGGLQGELQRLAALLIFSTASHKRVPPTQNWLPAPLTVKLIEAAIGPASGRPAGLAAALEREGRMEEAEP